MKRYIMTYLAAIVAAVSCTGVADLKVTEEPGTLVPIEFAVPMTKGAIYSEHDLVNNSSIFGMFAVDTQAESLNDDDGLNIRNQECRYVAATDKEKASLRFGRASNDKTLYFPMNSSVSYDFYTYHRWTSKIVEYEDGTMTISDSEDIQTVSEMTSTDRHVDVALGIASQYDVLWAKSVAPAAQDGDGNPIPGYNASYIRKTGNIPSFKFSHPAAGIRFSIVLDPESTEKIYKTDHLRLLTMKFTGAESKSITTEAALRVIDLDDQNLEGKFVASLATSPSQSWINNVGNSGNLNFDLLADADGDGVVETCVKEPVQLSSEHFIMPMDEPLEVTLTLRHDRINSEGTITGRWPEVVKTFTLDPKDFGAAESGYKAGIMYNYKIVVKYVNDTPNTPTNDKIEVAIVPETAPDKVVDMEVVPPFEVSEVSVTAKTASLKLMNLPEGLECSLDGGERAVVDGEDMVLSDLIPDTDYSLTFLQGGDVLETVDFKTDPEPESPAFSSSANYDSFSFKADSYNEEYYTTYSWEVWSKVKGELICYGDDVILGEQVNVGGLEWDTEYTVRIFLGHKVDGFVYDYKVKTDYGIAPPTLYLNNYDIEWEYDTESGEIKIVPIEGRVEDVTKLEYILQDSISDIPPLDDPRWTDVPIRDDKTVTIDCASYNDGLPEYDSEKKGYYLYLFIKKSGDKWARPINAYEVTIKIKVV